MKFLAVKNFERFQHYKDRAPLWIKMHTSVLSDYALLSLHEAAQAQLFKLWVLASRMDNRIPNNKQFIGAQIFSKKLYLSELIAAGFLVETDEPAKPLRADWSSRYVPADVRARVFASTEGHCAACGSTENLEIDHIVPISKGGTGDEANLQPLCRKCNRKKRSRGSVEYEATQDYADAEPREEDSREELEGELEKALQLHPAEAEAEAGLAVMLASDADRNALTVVVSRASDRVACLTALQSMLTGNDPATPRPSSVVVFGQALRDLATNGERMTARKFRNYLAEAERMSAPSVPPSGASATAKVTGARQEHWTDKRTREEREEGERQLVRIRAGNVEQRRGKDDGEAWWARMQRDAKATGANPYLYAYDRLHEPAKMPTEAAHV